jgi:hypothetical protein
MIMMIATDAALETSETEESVRSTRQLLVTIEGFHPGSWPGEWTKRLVQASRFLCN